MNHPVLASIFIVSLALGSAHSEPGTDSSQGGVSLFNGKDLDGWTTKQTDNHDWSVVDGVIDCNPQGDASGDRNPAGQHASIVPYAKKRAPEHVPLLWKFFENIMSVEPAALDADLMEKCLELPNVGLANLTMGMFWSCPKKSIATDAKNLGFAETKGITGRPKKSTEYLAWLPRVRAAIGGDGVEFSRQAHLWATNTDTSFGAPFDSVFPDNRPDPVLDNFSRVIGVLREVADNPEDLLSMTLRKRGGSGVQIRVNIGRWAVTAIRIKPSQRLIDFIVPSDHSEAIRYRL